MASSERTPVYTAMVKEHRDPRRLAQRSRERIAKIMKDVNGS